MFDLKSEWGFFFKLVIDSDGAGSASGSASTLPRVLMRLGSLQNKISIKLKNGYTF